MDDKNGRPLSDTELLFLLGNNRDTITRLLSTVPQSPEEAPPKSADAQIAAGLRESVTGALGPVVDLLNSAAIDGFEIAFGIGKDHEGKHALRELKITKTY